MSSGSVGLSPPTPCSDEQNLPAHAQGRALAGRLLDTAGACWTHAVWKGRRLSAAKGLAGIARACVDAACVGDRFCLSHRGVVGERVIGESLPTNALRDGPAGGRE